MGQRNHSCQVSGGVSLTMGGGEEETTQSIECISINIMGEETSPSEALTIRRAHVVRSTISLSA